MLKTLVSARGSHQLAFAIDALRTDPPFTLASYVYNLINVVLYFDRRSNFPRKGSICTATRGLASF